MISDVFESLKTQVWISFLKGALYLENKNHIKLKQKTHYIWKLTVVLKLKSYSDNQEVKLG